MLMHAACLSQLLDWYVKVDEFVRVRYAEFPQLVGSMPSLHLGIVHFEQIAMAALDGRVGVHVGEVLDHLRALIGEVRE